MRFRFGDLVLGTRFRDGIQRLEMGFIVGVLDSGSSWGFGSSVWESFPVLRMGLEF